MKYSLQEDSYFSLDNTSQSMTYNKLTKHVNQEKVTGNDERDNGNKPRDSPYAGINIEELKVTMLQILKKIWNEDATDES